ncbi:putative melanoma-associated antigen [Trypoxylus dichotomus]
MSKRTRSQTLNRNSQLSQHNTTNEDDANLKDYVNKCVRYLIYRSGSNEPVKKAELKKNVLSNIGKNFDFVIKKAGDILDKVYGFKLVACDDNGYITVQNIDSNINELKHNINDENIPADIKKVLIMLILTNIFMSKNPVSEASLCMFLNTLGINPDYDKGIFGKIKDFVNITMVKQNYIVLQTDSISKEVTYIWGARAERTISKHKILNFVSKIYGDKQPSSWESQYQEANQQFDDTNNVQEI